MVQTIFAENTAKSTSTPSMATQKTFLSRSHWRRNDILGQEELKLRKIDFPVINFKFLFDGLFAIRIGGFHAAAELASDGVTQVPRRVRWDPPRASFATQGPEIVANQSCDDSTA